MTKTQQIQDLLTRKPEMSVAQIANKLKVSKVTVYAARSKMRPVVTEAVPVATADTKQVGGNHYTSLDIQPWEIIERNKLGFFDGNALKYLLRFRAKGGVEDLEKAKHYLDKLIELERGRNA